MITVEKASERDADDILSLLTEILDIHHRGRPDIFASSGAKYTRENLVALFSDPNAPSFTVRENGEFRGYALCRLRRSDGTPPLKSSFTLYIDDLCVLGSCRGQGLGTTLLEYLIPYSREQGCQRVELNVWEFNDGARRLYERFGFVTQRRQLEYLL